MKNFALVSLLLITLLSCDDFTQKNLDVAAPTSKQEVNNADLLLTDTARINSGEFTLEKLLANTGTFVTEPLIQKLNQNIEDLNQSINQYCGSLDAFSDITKEQVETLRIPIQENWKKSMRTFHQLEMMAFGPATEITNNTMESLYSFDGEEKCRLDAQLFQLSLRGPSRLPQLDVINNYNIRGLDSLEPLFFADPNKSRCSRVNPRIAKWFEGPLLNREKTVCTYSKHILSDMVKKANDLAKRWSPLQGHYTAAMLNGSAGSPLEIVNTISQAMFFLDTNTKDIKIAYPAGFEVRIDGTITKCPDNSCPDKAEHPYSDFGFDAIESSVEGFRYLFFGINSQTNFDGNGFDDLLINREFKELSDTLRANTDTLLNNIRSLKKETTLREALKNIDPAKCESTTSENRLEEVCAIVWDIRKVTDLLKNEYLSALQELSAPRQAQGDND